MTTQPRKRLIFRWTAPRNILAVILFIALAAVLQYIIITFTISMGAKDPTGVSLPFLNVTISLLYHFLPVAVIIALTASFTYLTAQTATITPRIQPSKRPLSQPGRQRSRRLKSLRKLSRRLQYTARKVRNRILRVPALASIRNRIILAKAIIRSAVMIITVFVILILLVTIAAYPPLVPVATDNFYQWNTAFLHFVAATIRASKTIADAVPPINAVAAAINNALIAAAPAFRNTVEGAASAITSGLVSLHPTEKYLVIQNSAAWIVALATILYIQYVKTRRYRR